jgi:hypothetical protein
MNLSVNYDTEKDAKETVLHHKREFNIVDKKFKTYPDLKIATEDLRNFLLRCLKLQIKFEI